MLPSMFSLDQRLAELRPSSAELRVARQLREAAGPATRPARSIGDTVRAWLGGPGLPSSPSRLPTH